MTGHLYCAFFWHFSYNLLVFEFVLLFRRFSLIFWFFSQRFQSRNVALSTVFGKLPFAVSLIFSHLVRPFVELNWRNSWIIWFPFELHNFNEFCDDANLRRLRCHLKTCNNLQEKKFHFKRWLSNRFARPNIIQLATQSIIFQKMHVTKYDPK